MTEFETNNRSYSERYTPQDSRIQTWASSRVDILANRRVGAILHKVWGDLDNCVFRMIWILQKFHLASYL